MWSKLCRSIFLSFFAFVLLARCLSSQLDLCERCGGVEELVGAGGEGGQRVGVEAGKGWVAAGSGQVNELVVEAAVVGEG